MRKWLLIVVLLPVFVGLAAIKLVSAKRPYLFMRVKGTQSIVLSPDGEKLITVGKSGTDVWNIQSRSRLSHCSNQYGGYIWQYLNGPFLYIALVQDDQQVSDDLGITWTQPGYGPWTIERLNTSTGKTDTNFKFASEETQADTDFYGVRVAGDEVICESRRETRVLNAQDGRVLRVQKQHRTIKGGLVPDGKTLYVSEESDLSTLRFSRIQDEKTLWTWKTGVFLVWPHFSQDGRLVLIFKDGAIIARDTQTGVEKWRLRKLQSDVFALSPDNHSLYVAQPDGQIWAWPV